MHITCEFLYSIMARASIGIHVGVLMKELPMFHLYEKINTGSAWRNVILLEFCELYLTATFFFNLIDFDFRKLNIKLIMCKREPSAFHNYHYF